MSVFIESRTQSRQVAEIIENEILSGKLNPGEKLSSTRTLAKMFSVGQRVIISALDILEKKDFIMRKPRHGVFVNFKSGNSKVKEIMFLCLGGTPESSQYIKTVSEFMYLEKIEGKYEFFTRFIPGKTAQTRFNAELERIEKFGYPDCIILIASELSRADIEKALNLPYPFLFIGDFKDGDFTEKKYNRIGGDTIKPFLKCIEYAITENYSNIVFIAPESHFNFDYIKHAYEHAGNIAEDNNISLQRLLLANEDENYEEFLNKQFTCNCKPKLFIIAGIDPALFNQSLESFRTQTTNRFDIITLDYLKATSPVKHITRDFHDLYIEMDNALELITTSKKSFYGIKTVDISGEILDCTTI